MTKPDPIDPKAKPAVMDAGDARDAAWLTAIAGGDRLAFERLYLEHHLRQAGGNMTRVAERTGLERTHLYRKLKQLALNPGRRGEE